MFLLLLMTAVFEAVSNGNKATVGFFWRAPYVATWLASVDQWMKLKQACNHCSAVEPVTMTTSKQWALKQRRILYIFYSFLKSKVEIISSDALWVTDEEPNDPLTLPLLSFTEVWSSGTFRNMGPIVPVNKKNRAPHDFFQEYIRSIMVNHLCVLIL